MTPRYLQLHLRGELLPRATEALERLAACELCPRRCGVNRLQGELGWCQTGRRALVASYNLHFGEEAPLVGAGGSGTIFFAGCNLSCVFCQNYDISHSTERSRELDAQELARLMLELQAQGASNVNFVTPTHATAQILEALVLAADQGLRLPLVYNCSGYESLDTLRLLDGVVDIYMPDVKFWSSETAAAYCQAPDYPERARAALVEMRRQVGDLVLDGAGLAQSGLLVRHLLMPEGVEEAAQWMRFLAQELSPETYVNLMEQYRPCGQAARFASINRPPTRAECKAAHDAALAAGLRRLDDRNDRLAARLFQALLGGDS